MSEASIGFILKCYPRLSETFISQEIHLLEKQGFKLEIYSMREAREVEQHPIVQQIKANVIYVPEYFSKARWEMTHHNFFSFLANPLRYSYALFMLSAKNGGTAIEMR